MFWAPSFGPRLRAVANTAPARTITQFSFGTSGQAASVGQYTYSLATFKPNGTIVFSALDHTGTHNNANVQVLTGYMNDMTYADASTTKIVLDTVWPYLDLDNMSSSVTPGANWSILQRTNGAGTPTPLISAINNTGTSLTNDTWYPLTQDICIWHFRPGNGGALNCYSFLDFSDDGGATVAFTIEVNYMRSSSAG